MSILYRLKGNEPLLLVEQELVWVVQTGSVAVFATFVNDSTPVGDRRYLFSVEAGSALFGATPLREGEQGEKTHSPHAITNSFALLAVAIEETQLSQISITDLVTQLAAGDTKIIPLLETWLNRLSQIFGTQYAAAEVSRYTSAINPETAAQLPSIITNFHIDFFNRLHEFHQKQTEAAFRRFTEREQRNSRVVQEALSNLITAGYEELGLSDLTPPAQKTDSLPPTLPSNEKLLLIAAGAVGKAMGITIRPPAQSEDFSRVRDPVEAIARASQVRTRRVTLEDEWWRDNNGPLLAYTIEDQRPVALLPAGQGYVLFDSLTQTRCSASALALSPVNKTVAATLEPFAQMFYRPLPQSVDKPLQLFLFGAKGYEKDIALILVLGIVGTLLGMVVPWGTGLLIDNAIPDSDRLLLWQIGIALFALGCGRTIFQLSQGIISLRVASAADMALQPAIWDRLLKLSPAFFRQYTSGDLVSRTLTISKIRNKISGATLRTLLGGLFALLNLVLMFVYSWQLALVGVGIALLTTVVTLVSGWLVLEKTREQLGLDGVINGFTVQLIYGVAALRVAMAEARAFAAWADRYSKLIRLEVSLQRITDYVSVFNEALTLITSALLYWIAIMAIEMDGRQGGGGITPGTFLAFNSAFGIFLGGVSSLSNTAIDILGIMPLWERAEPILRSLL